MQEIELPNGTVVEFPANMSHEQMSIAIQKNFPELAVKNKPEDMREKEILPDYMTPGTMPDVTPKYGSIKEAAKAGVETTIPYIRPSVEGLSAAAGGIGGTALAIETGPFAPAVGAASAAWAYTGAKQILDRIEEWATLPPEIKKQPALQQMKNTMQDFKTGLTFEFGGPAAMKILGLAGKGVAGGYGKIKDVIRKNAPALTDDQISKRAAEIIQEHRGTIDQYDKNLIEANKIAEQIPGFKATIGEKTADPGLIKLQRGLETKSGIAAELGEVKKADNIEAIEKYLKGQFSGSQTVDDVIKDLTAQKSGLTTAREATEKTAKLTEKAIPTESKQVTGRRITESIEEARKPVKKIEKEYWEKVPDYEMTPTETERVFKELSSEPSIAQDAVKKHYELYKQRPKTIKGLQTAERELNDIIFDPNADATTKRALGKIKTAINEDFRLLGEAAEQGDFATLNGKVIHPKKIQRQIDEIDMKLEKDITNKTVGTGLPKKPIEYFEDQELPDGWYVHGRGKETIESTAPIQFSKDWDVAENYSHYLDEEATSASIWLSSPKKSAYILDLTDEATTDMDKIVKAAREDYINGQLPFDDPNYIQSIDDIDDIIRESFAPTDIVDTAGGFDSPEYYQWLEERFLMDGVLTPNGMVIFDPKGFILNKATSSKSGTHKFIESIGDGQQGLSISDATPDIPKIKQALKDNKTPAIMQIRGEETAAYNKRLVQDFKQKIGGEVPTIAGKEKPIVTFLKEQKAILEKQLAESEPAQNAAIAYANAKAFSRSQMQNRFKSGVIKELEMQGTFEGGKKIPTEKRPLKLMDVESADKFINAVGKEKASDIMLRHYADDMANKVKYDNSGLMEPASLSNWINKNSKVLERYGIKSEFKDVGKAHNAMQEARIAEKDFTKSIAEKMLNSDPQNAIQRAFEGGEGISGKNTGDIMRSLVKKIKNNPDAKKGLENSFKDFIYSQAKTTAETLKGDSQLSKAALSKSLRRYAPAQAVLYKGQPEKIKALKNVRDAILIMNRTAKGVGGGSDTSEKMNTMMSVIGSIAHVPGVSYTTKLAKIGLGMVKNLNQEETSDFIAKMLYDPDIAKIIEMASRKNPPVEVVKTNLKNYFERAAIQTAREANKRTKNDNTNTK